jgi:hypothetical protein
VAWQDAVIRYCERNDQGFWSEPLNALTNLAFLATAVAAYALWKRQARSDHFALVLVLLTAAVGVGSFIFHTVATQGAELFDVIPIAIFIYCYFFLVLRRYFRLGMFGSVTITVLFAAGSDMIDSGAHHLNGSVAYLPALSAMAVFAGLLGPWSGSSTEQLRCRAIARGLASAALLFLVSLIFRTVDRDVCPVFPLGTHFLWHVLNAGVLWLLLRTVILAGTDSQAQAPPGDKAGISATLWKG